MTIRTWTLSSLDVIYMELSTARINGASEKTLDTWLNIAESLKNMLVCYSLLTSICTYVWSRMSYVCSSVNVICLFVCSCVCLCMSVSIGLVSKLQTSFLQLSFYYVSLPFPFSPPVFSGPGTPPFVSAYCLSFERALM